MDPRNRFEQTFHERIGIAPVAQFFLRLYALKLGAAADAPSRYTLVNSSLSETQSIYDLSVKIGHRFETRRLAVSMLGTHGRSKSQCYKAVFDRPIVIKIPAVPIKTFRSYVQSLQSQRRIVDAFDAGNRIIAPGVAAFFKCTQVAGEIFHHSPDMIERWGVRWLENHPEYHGYLKIGDSFVFFMDLSTHAFLSSVIGQIHDVSADIPEEILRHPNVLWNFNGFENRYGDEFARVCFQMNGVWNEYDEGVRHSLRKARLRPRTVYETRLWLLSHLAGRAPRYPEELTPEFISAIEGLRQQLQEKHRGVIRAYRKTIQAYIRRTAFAKNKARIQGLVVSLLDLLAWLRQRRLAIRDLKPDNLFIAGQSEHDAHLAIDPGKYYLGLIDIETAVGIGDEPNRQAQPLLGGTPSYATLSQFFPNQILSRVYPDLACILHLQDWYAVIAMVYEIATGARLFSQTRKLLVDIKALSRRLQGESGEPLDAYSGGNFIFWRRAGDEFERAVRSASLRLRSIGVDLSASARSLIVEHARPQLDETSRDIETVIAKLSRTMKRTDQQWLAGADLQQIAEFRQQIEKTARISPIPSQTRDSRLELIRLLENRRRAADTIGRGLSILEQAEATISIEELLTLMFHTVAVAMETAGPGPWRRAARSETDAA